MKAKRFYQTPAIEKAVVELEGGFCASVDANQKTKVETTGHTVTSSTDDEIEQWNSTSWD
ncbi:MAG: hypothetical protein E7091_08170 [Bacteroidales bacterium]|nr:hypothetical protein [Bacteroidales bacterium]